MSSLRLVITIAVSVAALAAGVSFSDPMGSGIPGRTARAVSPFEIINIDHTPCRYDSKRQGTCMLGVSCTAAGGRFNATNPCDPRTGSTFGVCCLLQQTCDGVIMTNNTYFVNPDFPSDTTESQTCEITVMPPRGTCYLRLDFTNFTIHDPVQGACVADQFHVPEAEHDAPMLCGYNNETHMYIYVRDLVGKQNVTLRFNLGEWNGPRQWMINVAQIECGQDWTPGERGCLQVHMAANDTVRSYNYDERNPGRSTMLAGLDYTVCVRQAQSRCYVRWVSEFFSLSASNGTTAVGQACTQNYVLINQGFDVKQKTSIDRYCGDVFGARKNSTSASPVISTARPYHVRVRTSTNATALGRGFILKYSQLQCLNTRVISYRD
ncbi:uncharacterized protein LOC108864481 [Galendromus occidentalis]|uniref:Uncharacterized protein LOC108864481 n=1 Tax=Galendromus occidentalis TaxID=34638 RepID=A0AAJ7L6K1_9ACAR|nr:uncharacterized protein LOC108864481 [Galendromus occidentalis]